jgi:MerR family transcriptional regulator, copper efflux regulator
MKTFGIGEMARRSKVSVETVRYYEREGLLQHPQRKPSGYRQYDEQTVAVLQFIMRAKEFGFTLKEIKSLLAFKSNTTASRAEFRQQAQNKVAEMDTKIDLLQRMRNGLQRLVDKCHGDGSIAECPIMKALHRTDSN